MKDKISEKISTRNVIKLNGSNYQVWKYTIFVACSVHDIFTARKVKLDEHSAPAKIWIKDAKAIFISYFLVHRKHITRMSLDMY